MPSVTATISNPRTPSEKWPADEPIRSIEYAMQQLVNSGATASDIDKSGAYATNDSALIAAIKTSLAARS